MAAPEVNQINPPAAPAANQITRPAPPGPPMASSPARPAEVAAPSANKPPPWSIDTVRPVKANSNGQRAPRSPDDDATDTDKLHCQELAKLP